MDHQFIWYWFIVVDADVKELSVRTMFIPPTGDCSSSLGKVRKGDDCERLRFRRVGGGKGMLGQLR